MISQTVMKTNLKQVYFCLFSRKKTSSGFHRRIGHVHLLSENKLMLRTSLTGQVPNSVSSWRSKERILCKGAWLLNFWV